MVRKPPIGFLIFFLAALAGCLHPVSGDLMARVDKKQTFSEVMENPEAYMGFTVLWGGVIERIRRGAGGTELIVSQAPLYSDGYPNTAASDREFVAHTSWILDPQIFQQGSKITLVGEIDGVETNEPGGEEGRFPVVRIIEIHGWQMGWGRFPLTREWELNQYSPHLHSSYSGQRAD